MEFSLSNLLKYIPVLLGLVSCVPASSPSQSTSSKVLLTQDHNYEELIGMVQLYAQTTSNGLSELENPVVIVGRNAFLKLEFDLFQDNFIPVSTRYIHCQSDWSPSNLADIRFLNEYNEFPIESFDYSINTKIQYVSYNTTLPTPIVPGNYLVCVYRGNDKQDLLFTRRILVVETSVEINPKLKMSSMVVSRTFNQQLEFSMNYANVSGSVNPIRDFKVVILQNHNWRTALSGLQPTLIRQDQSYLEYHHFNQENEFRSGNEFRFFDLRSVDFRGQNVSTIKSEEDRVVAFVLKDRSRKNQAYSQLNTDINGSYLLENRDPGDTPLMSEYIWTYFQLESEPVAGDVYVSGKFNNWRMDDQNQMAYDAESGTYRGKVLLRQGYYNYAYFLKSATAPFTYFEGDFFQTSNEYEIIVYLRDPLTNIDRIVGYTSLSGGL